MMGRLSCKRAIVTGAAQGIGRASAELFAREGATVIAIDRNSGALATLLRTFLPGMVARGRGSIINMASVAGPLIGVTNRYVYCASKAAVAGITRSVALDFVGTGIRCNAICPGTVQSPSLDQRLAATGDAAAAVPNSICCLCEVTDTGLCAR